MRMGTCSRGADTLGSRSRRRGRRRGPLAALRSAAHVHVGCGSFAEYVERLFGYKPRTTQEKLRVAEALEGLPQLAQALEGGALSWCAARELSRVAAASTEGAWLEAARGKTVRQLEELVASRRPGDEPTTPPQDLPRPRVLRFEVAPETFALFRDAMQQIRRLADSAWDDDAVLLSMARYVLAGPGDAGRSSYQVSLTVCQACGSGQQLASGEPVAVGAEVVSTAQCDAQHIGELLPIAANENASGDETPKAVIGAAQRDAHVGASGSPGSHIHSDTAERQGTKQSINKQRIAKQSVPPALRRAVLARDQHRCRVPGCTHTTFVDVHHIQPRSEGGRNEARNLITICGGHHRATHRGELIIKSDPNGGPTFLHADGTPYGHPITAAVVDAHAKAFSALRQLGFREREIRAVLTELLADEDLREPTPEHLLREALRKIRPVR